MDECICNGQILIYYIPSSYEKKCLITVANGHTTFDAVVNNIFSKRPFHMHNCNYVLEFLFQ